LLDQAIVFQQRHAGKIPISELSDPSGGNMTTLSNVIFEGKVAPGKDPEFVKQAMMNLLKIDSQGIKRIFSGRAISLKTGVNASTADKYQKAIEAAGAVCKVETMAAR
jgi:hypothetical protein